MQKHLFLLAIALIILIPASGVLPGLGAMSEETMRAFEGRKKTAISQDFSKWFTDNLRMRELFLKAYASVLFYVFGQSSNPDVVQVGQNGFLFLSNRHSKTFSTHTGLVRLTKNQRLSLGDGFKSIITLFEKKGIPVLIAIAPDKATIYGEYYPKWVRHVIPTFPRDNFNTSDILKKHVLFLEDALLEYKKYSDYLYWKTDTHWNRMGAYLGYITLMDSLEKLTQKKLKRVPLLGWQTEGPYRGDLARINRVARAGDNMVDLLFPLNEPEPISRDRNKGGDTSTYFNVAPLNPLNAVLVVDSFYNILPSVYRRTFHTTHEIHYSKLDKASIEGLLEEDPPIDLLIFLLVERSIPTRDRELHQLAKPFIMASDS